MPQLVYYITDYVLNFKETLDKNDDVTVA